VNVPPESFRSDAPRIRERDVAAHSAARHAFTAEQHGNSDSCYARAALKHSRRAPGVLTDA